MPVDLFLSGWNQSLQDFNHAVEIIELIIGKLLCLDIDSVLKFINLSLISFLFGLSNSNISSESFNLDFKIISLGSKSICLISESPDFSFKLANLFSCLCNFLLIAGDNGFTLLDACFQSCFSVP